MSTPKRIQMTRQRPWRDEHPDAVIVDRRTRWGNPFRVGKLLILTGKRAGERMNAQECVSFFRHSLERVLEREPDFLDPLRGKDLACWCPLDQPCHADVLLEIANGDPS